MTRRPLQVRTGELPAQLGAGQDRIFVGDDVVVVLDGASGTDRAVSVADYVDALGAHLLAAVGRTAPLPAALETALARTAADLHLRPGDSPSSTVSMVRRSADAIDVLVLGDTPVYVATNVGIERVFDDRLARLPVTNRPAALARLRAGGGFDEEHRRLLREMTREKAPFRNRAGGYWIAEADPHAGGQALVRSFPGSAVSWCAVVTDGADDPMRHLGITIDHAVELDESQLAALLRDLHRWEEHDDPHGKQLPRFKPHDDKAIAVVTFP